MIRTCAVDSNSLTTDTELVRIPESCGIFDFVPDAQPDPNDDKVHRLHGCISVCEDSDGCNRGSSQHKGRVPLWSVCGGLIGFIWKMKEQEHLFHS